MYVDNNNNNIWASLLLIAFVAIATWEHWRCVFQNKQYNRYVFEGRKLFVIFVGVRVRVRGAGSLPPFCASVRLALTRS